MEWNNNKRTPKIS